MSRDRVFLDKSKVNYGNISLLSLIRDEEARIGQEMYSRVDGRRVVVVDWMGLHSNDALVSFNDGARVVRKLVKKVYLDRI